MCEGLCDPQYGPGDEGQYLGLLVSNKCLYRVDEALWAPRAIGRPSLIVSLYITHTNNVCFLRIIAIVGSTSKYINNLNQQKKKTHANR